MPDGDREERRLKIRTVFASANRKAKAGLAGKWVKLDVGSDADGAVVTAWVKGQGRVRVRFSVGEDYSVVATTASKRIGAIPDLCDDGIEDKIADVIISEVRKQSG
jgi:hypothetical protein